MGTTLKTLGYLVSTLSVVLLAIPGWKSASESPPLMFALLGGMAASIGGMFLRWCSHISEQRRKKRDEAKLAAVAEGRASSSRAA